MGPQGPLPQHEVGIDLARERPKRRALSRCHRHVAQGCRGRAWEDCRRSRGQCGPGILCRRRASAQLHAPRGHLSAHVRGGYSTNGRTAAAKDKGGRPRPPVDLGSCLAVVNDIRADLGDDVGRVIDQDDLVDLWGRTVDIGTRVRIAILDSQRWAYHSDTGLKDDIKSTVDDLITAERTWEDHRAREDSRGWKDWLEADWHQGARRAHAYTKVPTGWHPTVATSARGIVSAAPSAILHAMRDKYAKYWAAAERPVTYRWPDRCDALPLLTPEQIRSASLSFARRTAVTYDGWHVRQFALVSDEGLTVLATILAVVEKAGMWPTQASLVTMPLIGKPRGGHRGIGKLAALDRVWTKSRRPYAETWEAEHDRPFFAASAGAGPIDAVHRQAMRSLRQRWGCGHYP